MTHEYTTLRICTTLLKIQLYRPKGSIAAIAYLVPHKEILQQDGGIKAMNIIVNPKIAESNLDLYLDKYGLLFDPEFERMVDRNGHSLIMTYDEWCILFLPATIQKYPSYYESISMRGGCQGIIITFDLEPAHVLNLLVSGGMFNVICSLCESTCEGNSNAMHLITEQTSKMLWDLPHNQRVTRNRTEEYQWLTQEYTVLTI